MDNRNNRKKTRRNWFRRIIRVAVFCLEFLTLWKFFGARKRGAVRKTTEQVRDFVKGEAREVKELVTGQESPGQYCHDTWKLLKDFFIPHRGNDHRPKALRPKSLVLYLAAAIVVKVAVSGLLFLYYPSTASLAQIVATEIIRLANRDRAAAGLGSLRSDAVLSASALAKGQDMMARDYFAHDTPEGKKPWSWIDRNQYDYVFAGENLAVDFVDAETIHQAFMKSPTHRSNILNSRYQDIGVAVVSGQLGGHATELLVQFFGTRRAGGGTFAAAGERAAAARAVRPERPAPTVKPSPAAVVSPPSARVAATPAPTIEPLPEPPTLVGSVSGAEAVAAQNPGGRPTPEPPGSPSEPIMVLGARTHSDWVVEFVLNFSNIFFIGLIAFLTVALLLNIFIRIRVQHTDVILQSIAVLALITAMILIKFHFVESLGHELRIL